MGRWAPGARGRLAEAALELYVERGFEQTTVGDIAERAGVTERTFFRHFADKREVLFDGSQHLQDVLVSAISGAEPGTPPVDVVATAYERAAELLEGGREHSAQRSRVIAATPGLQERELLKLAGLTSAAAAALQERGVAAPAALLAAETGGTVFRVAFDRWVAGQGEDLRGCLRTTLAELRGLTGS
ncbi:TetR family transcriptional regulator [Motilibacter rhizosphaerae]|uniref:TetR family transcriptional regulator n=1 Tax=Motilibacter rhizosphaerae TaxID=598652 RepID=A0A4Q7NVA9_9ACTN|nr:TetR family transcriptional regulator [Motilibacter rhizosphaerae]RZS91095.1 TetR family transcriptional regulator [Motilibacter rhizosphaerae]